jgi:AAA domain
LIVGAYATGKTTLVTAAQVALRLDGIDVEVRGDVARQTALPLNLTQTIATSTFLIAEGIRQELELLARCPEVILCDRGAPDVLSHTRVLDLDARGWSVYGELLSATKAWIRTYDAVLWAKVDEAFPIEDDGIRVLDRSYRLKLEAALTDVFDDLDVAPTPVASDVEERIATVQALVAAALAGSRRPS